MRCFPNNKPWITSDLMELLNKKRPFWAGDRELPRSVQRELKVRLRESKEAYRQQVESQLQ